MVASEVNLARKTLTRPLHAMPRVAPADVDQSTHLRLCLHAARRAMVASEANLARKTEQLIETTPAFRAFFKVGVA